MKRLFSPCLSGILRYDSIYQDASGVSWDCCSGLQDMLQVSKLLLTHAKEDMGSSYFKTRDLLTSLQTLRMRKIIEGIKEIQGPVTITLRDLSAFELNQVRHVFLHGMDNFHELAEAVQNTQGNPETDAADAGGVLDGGGALL